MLKNKLFFAVAVAGICALLIGALGNLASGASKSSHAQKSSAVAGAGGSENVKTDPPKDFDDWRLLCETPDKGEKQCQIFERLTFGKEKEKPQGIALTALVLNTKMNDKPATVVRLITPLGTVLAPGIAIKFDDDKEVKVPYWQCFPGGCLVNMVFDDAMMNKMKNGKIMFVAYRMPNGKDATLKVSLKGFAPALEAMNAADSKG